jgi:hypothetical protein
MAATPLTQLAAHFGKLAAGAYKQNLSPVLDMLGQAVKAEVEKEIGEPQGSIGPYPATAPLSIETVYKKAKAGTGKGGDPFSPLWETGAYHDSIGVAKDIPSLSVEIGTNLDYVEHLEVGTGSMPPRPVLGPSALRAIPPLLPVVAHAAAQGIMGGAWSGLSVEGVTKAGGKATATVQP